MTQCIKCGSSAINHHLHGRDGSDPDLCDVCYWRARAGRSQEVPEMTSKLCEASHYGFLAIKNVLARRWRSANNEGVRMTDEDMEMFLVADVAHNLPELAMRPNDFSPERLASFIMCFKTDQLGSVDSFRFWKEIEKLIGANPADLIGQIEAMGAPH